MKVIEEERGRERGGGRLEQKIEEMAREWLGKKSLYK